MLKKRLEFKIIYHIIQTHKHLELLKNLELVEDLINLRQALKNLYL